MHESRKSVLRYASVPENLGRKIAFGVFKVEDLVKFVMYLALFAGLSAALHMLYLLIFLLPLAWILAFKRFHGLEFWQYLKLRHRVPDPTLNVQIYFGELLYNGRYYFEVLEVSGLNYEFMSEEDRAATLMKYEELLNSCNFPMQLIVHTVSLDYTPFLMTVSRDTPTARSYKELIKRACEDLYIQRYFVVVGIDSFEISGIKDEGVRAKIALDKLRERIDIVTLGLRNIGLDCTVLKGQDLIDIFREVA